MKRRNHIPPIPSTALTRLLMLFLFHFAISLSVLAQTTTDYLTRYVKQDGAYSNSGLSWKQAKANVQDAINDLYGYMVANSITEGGKVYVASGLYTPTESTEDAGGTTLNLSFKIYAGITVYGGFNNDSPETTHGERKMIPYGGGAETTYAAVTGGSVKGSNMKFKYATILSGNLNSNRSSSLVWNGDRQNFTATYPGNTYHVVTFATNGFNSDGSAKPLSQEATVNGFTIRHGYANNSDATERYHAAYGGGVYAVDKARVEYCEVTQCTASRDGGGIYCDGGGVVSHCYVHTNQALGIGILYGQGGGVMLDGKGVVEYCNVTNNYGREGGGVALVDTEDFGRNNTYNYQSSVKASLIANNTASSEGGGLYMERGGVINGVGIYRNRCNGNGVIVNGTANGQAASVYAGEASRIYNSAIWGGTLGEKETGDEENIQYATSATEGSVRASLYFTALNNHDASDWTYTYKKGVFNLSNANDSTEESKKYISLKNPSVTPGVLTSGFDDDSYFRFNWQPYYFSAIATAGLQLMDVPAEAGVTYPHAVLEHDIVWENFTPTTTLGQRTVELETPTPHVDGNTYTLYVDPNRKTAFTVDEAGAYLKSGSSWDRPMNNLRRALGFFMAWKDNGSTTIDGASTTWPGDDKTYRILVKEGTLNTANNNGADRARASTIWMGNNIQVYGGYPSSLTGNQETGRDPMAYPTTITGKIIDDDYANNAANLIQFGNVTGAVLDGFHLNGANAGSKVGNTGANHYETEHVGAAIHVRSDKQLHYNSSGVREILKPGDTGYIAGNKTNTVRNCVISNCGALEGAAIYISGKDDTNTNTLTMENVIIHNCGTNYNAVGSLHTTGIDVNDGKSHGIIHVGENATVNMDHCDVLRNTGYGIYAKGSTAVVNMTNSVVYANLDREVTETNDWDSKTAANLMAPCMRVDGGTVNGEQNLLDEARSDGKSMSWKSGSISIGATCKAILTYSYSATSTTYPRFANSTRNCGVTQSLGDVTYYGSATDFMPGNMSPLVNAASYSGAHGATSDATWGTDIHLVNRDFGGLPDIGAVENSTYQKEYGKVYYVRTAADGGDDSNNGLSWNTAFATVHKATTVATTSGTQIWVAEGTYTQKNNTSTSTGKDSHQQPYAYMMTEGVDVYGGFPKVGNPAMDERQPKTYVSILQPGDADPSGKADNDETSFGRVLVQPKDFTTPTTWNGFTLQHGYLFSTYRQNISGDISQVNTEYIGRSGGAGAYLMANGILENCVIDNNMVFVHPNASGMSETNSGTGGGGYHQAGAGVYNTGGTIKNCVISNNKLRHKMDGNQSAWVYGAGLYMQDGEVFNTILYGNSAYMSDKTTPYHQVMLGAGAFLVQGKFYNNTIVNNSTFTFKTDNSRGRHIEIPGVYVYTGATMYNCIVANNRSTTPAENRNNGTTQEYDIPVCNYVISGSGESATYSKTSNNVTVKYSFVDVAYNDGGNLCKTNDEGGNPGKNTNIYLNRPQFSTTDLASNYDFDKIYNATTYQLVNGSPCVNTGTENIANVTIPDIDAAYTDRIQDCQIDIGAYEFNGANDITPDIETTYGTAYYYVTQNGRNASTASDPDNAACWEKLQKVLDAAGRYKYQNPAIKVVVKVASFGGQSVSGYTPLRTTEPTNEDPRLYSIMVPRGVEVWGGYTDTYTSISDNGFLEENRDITGHPTYFLGDYNVENTTATAYHVVKFTDYVFDANGNPYKTGDTVGGTSSYKASDGVSFANAGLRTLSTVTSDRGVVDGIYITGGNANAAGSSSIGINENQYGGAAIVSSYGHVRNCILQDNSASVGGGALYIEAGGVVSGCLIKGNEAAYGGAIYIERLDDLIANEQYPEEMAHISTCTIVRNTATVAGGGLWFYNNCRVNSSVFWRNTCSDQANVSGQTSTRYTGSTQTYRQYPFSYSAVERVRLAGTNNISVSSTNDDGVRFLDEDLYTLDDYSVLCNVGMPNELYNQFETDFGFSDVDYTFGARVSAETSSYIDIGARTNNSISITTPTKPEQLLLRLYVASPQDVDFDLVKKMRDCGDAVYSKIGSSFAYPMQHLEDALRYIRDARKSEAKVIGSGQPLKYFAANLPFEIIISKGAFYPQSDIYGNYGYSISNTFLVPEGVTIVGGMGCEKLSTDVYKDLITKDESGNNVYAWAVDDGRDQFYGQEYRAKQFYTEYSYDIRHNIRPMDAKTVLKESDTTIEGGGQQLVKPRRTPVYESGSGMTGITMLPAPLDEMRRRREMSDNNANGIYEPWEFKNQTVLSGRVINASDVTGVYHVITTVADEQYMGERPMAKESYRTAQYLATEEDVTAGMAKSEGTMLTGNYKVLHPGTVNPEYIPTGAVSREMGQPVEIDGLEIQDGHALDYSDDAISDESSYDYYHGGAIVVDGNWVSETDGNNSLYTNYKHQGVPQSVAYRDIPLILRNCTFQNNKAGYGGAVSTNSTLNIFNCSFAQNTSLSSEDTHVSFLNQETGVKEYYTNAYSGNGGAMYVTKDVTIVNSLFANNEAQDPLYGNDANLHSFRTLRNSAYHTTPSANYGGAGGCIYAGRYSHLKVVNCDFVKNKAAIFPVIYTQNPNTQNPEYYSSVDISNGYNEILSTIFWGNESVSQKPFANIVINHAAKGSSKTYSTSTAVASFPNVLPSSQDVLDSWSPAIWFSSYEDGRGQSPVYEYDMRNAPYKFGQYVPKSLQQFATTNLSGATDGYKQNCNIILSSLNGALDGPCFSVPSINAGAKGYMASADWSISRLNNIVDNGWGKMSQSIEQYYDDQMLPHYRANFNLNDGKYTSDGAYPAFHYDADGALSNDYATYSDRMQIGTERYMRFAESTGSTTEMLRVSYDPNPTHEQTYIDMGVYEYVHTELQPVSENEVDILWVSTEENIDNGEPDGSCWEQPTSDLQRAIETLLASRNGHAKEIRITDGEYSPIYTMGNDKLLTFYINTSELNAKSEIPDAYKDQLEKQYVKSLTITGGWAKNWKMTDASERNTEEYPAIIRSVPRSGVGTDKLNSVFRIEDARQWYGVKTSDNDNAKLNMKNSNTEASVIPITIEGLTFVNCNAVAVTATGDPAVHQMGAGFYYGDQFAEDGTTLAMAPSTGDMKLEVNRVILMASGDPLNDDYTTHDAPAAYIGKGGGDALVYNSLFHSNYGSPMEAFNTRVVNCTFALNHGILKLQDAGADSSTGLPNTSDTNTDDDGPMLAPRKARYSFGSGSMVHNSVFWRNGLKGRKAEGTDCVYPYNEASAAPGYGTQLVLSNQSLSSSNKFTYNALTDPDFYNELPMDNSNSKHETPVETDYAAQKYNIGISLDNYDAIYGPNFADPKLDAEEQADLETRDFHLQPSVRLMNTGSNDTYEAVVGVNPTEHTTTIITLSTTVDAKGNPVSSTHNTTYTTYDESGKNMTTRQEETQYPYVLGQKEGTFNGFEEDLSSSERVIAVKIDRGAYEFQNSLDRVIYVDPSHTDGNGSSWDKPYTSLQRAIDLVAVYYNAYGKEAYVFAKPGRINENIIMRDGVKVYGSIPASYISEADRQDEIRINPTKAEGNDELTRKWTEDDDKLKAYERQIINDRTGLVYPTANVSRTIINGLQNTMAQYSDSSLVDGIDIHGNVIEGLTAITSPVVNLNSNTGYFVLRNSLIRDNIVAAGSNENVPVVRIANGTKALLYDVLLQNNQAGTNSAVLELGNNAYAVNVTNVANNGNTVIGSETNNTKGAGKMISSINWTKNAGVNVATSFPAVILINCNADADADGYPFAPYIAAQGALYGDYPFITYQLDENSQHIDKCKATDYTAAMPAELQVFIDYEHDRDVLGNPRQIVSCDQSQDRGGVDRGCFETWRVGGPWTDANPAGADKGNTIIATTTPVTTTVRLTTKQDGSDKYDTKDYTSLYPYYPQEGSVVYIMPKSNLVLGKLTTATSAPDERGYVDADGNTVTAVSNPLYSVGEEGYLFQPAYLLVKEGGSLYAQGNKVGVVYLATERYYKNGKSASDASLNGDLSFNHLTALPYAFDYAKTQSVAYAPTASKDMGLGSTLLNDASLSADKLFDYSISDRSDWNYDFQTKNSSLWKARTNTTVDANKGILLAPAFAANGEVLYRFTTAGAWYTDYQYEESDTQWFKTITLTQHDDVSSASGGADFTSKEDMGWNCVGMPYLQAQYLTGERSSQAQGIMEKTARAVPKSALTDPGYVAVTTANQSDYQLHVPHTLWLYFNDTDTWGARNSWDEDSDNNNDGALDGVDYTVGNGHAGPTYLMTGEGFFTQTAAVGDEEKVTFSLPLWFAPAASPAPAKQSLFGNALPNTVPNTVPGVRLGGIIEKEELVADYRVYSRNRVIHVDGLTGSEHVTIHNVAGILYDTANSIEGNHTTRVQPGTYIVKVNKASWKLLVK